MRKLALLAVFINIIGVIFFSYLGASWLQVGYGLHPLISGFMAGTCCIAGWKAACLADELK